LSGCFLSGITPGLTKSSRHSPSWESACTWKCGTRPEAFAIRRALSTAPPESTLRRLCQSHNDRWKSTAVKRPLASGECSAPQTTTGTAQQPLRRAFARRPSRRPGGVQRRTPSMLSLPSGISSFITGRQHFVNVDPTGSPPKLPDSCKCRVHFFLPPVHVGNDPAVQAFYARPGSTPSLSQLHDRRRAVIPPLV
jgi:hypothetical protein